jgi:hypothetical protein
MTVNVSVRRAYALGRIVLEHYALALKQRDPQVHLATACQLALEQHPIVWRVYRAGIRAGLPSEFLRPRRRRAIPTPKDRAWDLIETLARTLVAASETPLTLREAVGRVVEANPDLYRQYATARRK